MQAGLDDTRVVEHHQGTLWKIVGQTCEHVLAYLAVTIEEQLAAVALREGKLGNSFVGQRVVVVFYMYVFGVHFGEIYAKIHFSREKVVLLCGK